jgi:SSS family solute:Na+ symporter
VGGIDGLKTALPQGSLDFFPSLESDTSLTETLTITGAQFLAFFGFIWWASWYPGAEPGGGGYIAQRMMSTKNEKHAVGATLFFQIAHYCVRPWPWILVGLSAIVLYSLPNLDFPQDLEKRISLLAETKDIPEKVFYMDAAAFEEYKVEQGLSDMEIEQTHAFVMNWVGNDEQRKEALTYKTDKRYGYVFAMKRFLPPGLMGLLLVSFFAAYMSTISTQLNWGASYLVNDFYARFIYKPKVKEHLEDGVSVEKNAQKKFVAVSRLVTVLLMIVGLIVSWYINSITAVWQFIMESGAGLGMVLILRWYWWRINAWSEIVATVAPFIGYALAHFVFDLEFPNSFFVTVGFTTVSWIVATFITAPTKLETLKSFYKKIEPDGFWNRKEMLGEGSAERKSNILNLTICWLSAVVMTYGLLFTLGKLILQEWQSGFVWMAVTVLSFAVFMLFIKRTKIFN